jgi:hypothetical protein
VPVTPSKRSQKRICISKKVTVILVSPEDTSSEYDWGTDLEIVAEKRLQEEYIDIKDILALPTPKEREKRGKRVGGGTLVITRSGRAVSI